MKKFLFIVVVLVGLFFAFYTKEKNPFSGKSTMAIVSNDSLFKESFAAYGEFIDESNVIENSKDALIVQEVGTKLRGAAEKWLKAEGSEDYLAHYEWEYHLVQADEINAWCMPGGKIVIYTGILPITKNKDGLATVMGHELAHALLNHGQQSQSANILKQLGAIGVAILSSGESYNTQEIAQTAYDAGSHLLGTLPFSRANETEADEIGLALMTIAGYNPEEACAFWSRMSEQNDNTQFDFLSTHPSDEKRINALQAAIPKAKEIAEQMK
ncbi:MAG: M48 family metallopeptidase [Spirochaetaceae bacterium]|jgi:predicted Zn-dependent protease|nr:M48 family metallopeptidase [Spirochaetaceae bacterium]